MVIKRSMEIKLLMKLKRYLKKLTLMDLDKLIIVNGLSPLLTKINCSQKISFRLPLLFSIKMVVVLFLRRRLKNFYVKEDK